MADYIGTSDLGLQFLGQAPEGHKFGYLTAGVFPVGFITEKKAYFYSEMQFTSLITSRDAVFFEGKSVYRGGAVLTCPGLPTGAFLFYFAAWRVPGLAWKLTTF